MSIRHNLLNRIPGRASSTIVLLGLACLLGAGLVACKDVTVDPKESGRIEGVVKEFESNEPIEGALVTTNPATNSVSTGPDGEFSIEPVSPDTYRVKAKKPGFLSSSVGVRLEEGQDVNAVVLLERTEDDSVAMDSEVTNWWVREETADSVFANVEYEVRNTGKTEITGYELYFEIRTTGGKFTYEVNGSSLRKDQADLGNFEKYIRDHSVEEVAISDTWATDEPGGKRLAKMR